jgi:hypothetical protein
VGVGVVLTRFDSHVVSVDPIRNGAILCTKHDIH